jgi:hypothetical protein
MGPRRCRRRPGECRRTSLPGRASTESAESDPPVPAGEAPLWQCPITFGESPPPPQPGGGGLHFGGLRAASDVVRSRSVGSAHDVRATRRSSVDHLGNRPDSPWLSEQAASVTLPACEPPSPRLPRSPCSCLPDASSRSATRRSPTRRSSLLRRPRLPTRSRPDVPSSTMSSSFGSPIHRRRLNSSPTAIACCRPSRAWSRIGAGRTSTWAART